MTKGHIKDIFKSEVDLSTKSEKIIDTDLWYNRITEEWMFKIHTVTKNHNIREYNGYYNDVTMEFCILSYGYMVL